MQSGSKVVSVKPHFQRQDLFQNEHLSLLQIPPQLYLALSKRGKTTPLEHIAIQISNFDSAGPVCLTRMFLYNDHSKVLFCPN